MRRRRLLGTVGALVGSAGCLRLSGGGSETTRPPTLEVTDTGTRTSAETDSGTTEPLDRPPGLQGDGVAVYLADSHVNALSRTSFTVSFRSTNLTRGETNEARKAMVGEAGALERWQDGSAIDMYRTADGSYWRQNVGGRSTYGHHRYAFDRQDLIRARDLRTLILAGQWDAPEETDDRAFEITADGIGEPQALLDEYEGSELKSYAAEGKVLESGIIAELAAEFSYLRQDDEGERLFKVRVDYLTTDVGSTDASKPDWYGTAVEQAPDVSARITDDGNFIRMEHAGGTAILPGTAVVLYGRGEQDRGNWGYRDLDRPVEAGTTLYLWMEDGEFRWNRGSRPGDANPTTLDGRYGFWMHREGAEYFGNIELPK
ncbi:hypothetical protein [Haloarchaeobius amylolyticus]|uniref:hypothetical protein n=1 Tax=Haloarchaeobius amylolyticus TaxID=1198296 RepID=UPI00226E21E9|nr:hypothetical protein [Haloarchaeobius amylolyticus]